MKSHYLNSIKVFLIKTFVACFAFTLMFGCIKDEQVFTTYSGELIYSFLKKDSTYTEFVKVIDKAGLRGMLNAYGSYTCLAPTNTAFRKYYRSISPSFVFDSLTNGQIDTIAKNHIISNKFLTVELVDGVIPIPNMNLRYIEIKYETNPSTNKLQIIMNGCSQIISKDNIVYNGVIHGINDLIIPSDSRLPEIIEKNENLSIFYKALELTHLEDSLMKIKDLNYSPKGVYQDEFNRYNVITPADRKFGYTCFVVANYIFNSMGIHNLDDLIAKSKEWYPSDSKYERDYTNRNNSLNQFIAYHLVNKIIYQNKFFFTSHAISNYFPDEFIETMLPNRLIKASMRNSQIKLNYQSGTDVYVLDNKGKTAINGMYHLINAPLIYNKSVDDLLLRSRIRLDFASLFPELTNNNMRCSRNITSFSGGDRFGYDPGYLSGVNMSKDTRLLYLSGTDDSGWTDYQGDDLVAMGRYDVTMRMLPVPPGTYEIRFGYTANDHRSVTQIYIDNKPVGIPLDLTIGADHPLIGYILDKETEDNGYENDKMMRNRGYMKGPNSFKSSTNGGVTARDLKGALRRIVSTFSFTEYEPHYIRFKSVIEADKQMQLDYIEYVPKNVYSPASGMPESRD